MITRPLLLILILLLAATIKSQSKVGYAYQPYPDAIKCGQIFYYLERSSPNFSRYNAFTGSSKKIESYDATKGVLSNKVGSLPGNCENETIESLWLNNRAFRIFNLNRAPDRSLENEVQTPDIIQCQHGILLYFQAKFTSVKGYGNPTGPIINFVTANNSIDSLWGIGCGHKNLNALIAEKKTFNIATQVVKSNKPTNSMTKTYPDLIRCKQSNLFIHYISEDKQWVSYRGSTPRGGNFELKLRNGRFHSAERSSLLDDCTYKSLDRLIGEGRAFNINTPVLSCPNDIESINPLVQFKAVQTGNLTLSYSHQPNTTFPVGQTTNVTVTAKDTDSNINQQCTFGIKILDKQPPNLTCPANIRQKNRIVTFAANAKDNVSQKVRISYSQASGSKFRVGNTTVTVTAIDEAGNQAQCTFNIEIEDQTPPTIKCPADITQRENKVTYAAIVSDNGSENLEINYSQAPGSEFLIGKTLVTVTATDGNGNQAQCTFNVTILDIHPPMVQCPADITQKNPIATFVARASDNITKKVKITYSHASGSKFSPGETTVTVTAHDDAGNQARCTFVVNIDIEAPNLKCPANISSKERVVSFAAAATDNGAASLEIFYSHAPGSKFQIGETAVVVKAIDGSGNQGECTFKVTVVDSQAPNVHCPPNISSKNSAVSFAASATDDSNQNVNISYSHEPGTRFKVGKTQVTVTATDQSGNKATCKFDVNILPSN